MAGIREEGWGVEKNYSDTTQRVDDLFFEYARIVKEIQPKVFVAENVMGITLGSASSILGRTQFGLFGQEQDTIYHTLTNCGYNVRYKVLNAKDYGVPQQRERLIIIGIRNDIDAQITFPKGSRDIVTIKEAFDGLVNPQNELIESSMSEGKVKDVAYKLPKTFEVKAAGELEDDNEQYDEQPCCIMECHARGLPCTAAMLPEM